VTDTPDAALLSAAAVAGTALASGGLPLRCPGDRPGYWRT